MWRAANDAAHMAPDAPVLGLHMGNRAWALPWWIMKNHHVANLKLDNQPILITFCELCSSAAAFNPVLKRERYTFRIVGFYNGTILVSDFETGSFSPPFRGEAVEGPLEGERLTRLPLYQCTWSEWLSLHPDAFVLDGAEALRGGHGHRYRPGSPGIDSFSATLLQSVDKRLPHNDLVLGVEINAVARAYPLSTLDQIGLVVNDTLGEKEIVVLHQPETMLAIVFSRRIGDRVLVFEGAKDGRIVDCEYQGHWNYAGEAEDGALAGRKLSYVSSGVEEWYIWAAYHPETEIFGGSGTSKLK